MNYEIIHQPEQKLFKTEVDGRSSHCSKYRANDLHIQ